MMIVGFFEDPLYAWLYPDADERHDALRDTFRLMLSGGINNGQVLIDDSNSALAIWTAPGHELLEESDMQTFVSSLHERLGERAQSALDGMQACSSLAPPQPHATVHSIVVRPKARGTGIGGALLASVLRRCDDAGWTVALESSNPRNLEFYRRAGFRIAGEVTLADGGPTMWPMERRPMDAAIDR